MSSESGWKYKTIIIPVELSKQLILSFNKECAHIWDIVYLVTAINTNNIHSVSLKTLVSE